MRKIAREEKRDRETVRRVVRSEDVQLYIKLLRLQFFALGDPALDAILHQLVTGKDGRLGMEILTHIGVVPSERERHRMLHGNARADADSD